MNKFVFRPIGQGLFYTGALLNRAFNFVYDCGSWDHKVKIYETYLNDQIDDYVAELGNNKEIDFVVISHMHLDHFNGLYRLASQKRIKTLYLPYLGGNDFNNLLMLAGMFGKEADLSGKSDLFNFIIRLYIRNFEEINSNSDDLSLALNNIRRVIVVGQDEDLHYDEPNIEQEQERDYHFYYAFSQSVYDDSKDIYWEFKFCNKALNNNLIKNLYMEICNKLGIENIRSTIQLYNYIINKKSAINEIAKIYKRIITEITPNATSIVLYHYPLYRSQVYVDFCHRECFHKCLCREIFDCRNDKLFFYGNGGTLLTGDAEFDMTMATKLTKRGTNCLNVDIMQVPHHGSLENVKLIKDCNIIANKYIISYGLGNSHKHPDALAIKLLNSKHIFSATQIQGISYYIE